MDESAKVAERTAGAVERKKESHYFFLDLFGEPKEFSACGKVRAKDMKRNLGPNVDPGCPECWVIFVGRSL